MDFVLDCLRAEFVGGAMGSAAFTPPPATTLNAGLWSRPVAAVAVVRAVRPNSPPHTTSVPSSRPRCFKSVSSPAAAVDSAAPQAGVRH